MEHASSKHPQTVGVVEQSQRAPKRALNLNANEQWSDWCKYVQSAILIPSTSYNSATDCNPTVNFHGDETKTNIRPVIQ